MSDETTEAPEVPSVLKMAVAYTQPTPAVRYDLLDAGNRRFSNQRLAAASLALCWPYLQRKVLTAGARYECDVAAYGGAVLDYLIEQGATIREIVRAGNYTYLRAIDDLPGLEGQRQQEGNCEPEEGSGTA